MAGYRSWGRVLSSMVATAATALLWGAGAATAQAQPATTTPGLGQVRPKPLPAITIGVGKYPNLVVDAAGTAHVVYTEDGGSSAPDTLEVCGLLRGGKACATQATAPTPQAPDSSTGGIFAGNLPSLNHDFDGAVPLDIDGELFVLERRFPANFMTPDGSTSDSNDFEWFSTNGGASLTGPAQIGDNQMAGGAVAFGDPQAPSVGTISRLDTYGTFFQGTQPGVFAGTEKAQLGPGNEDEDGSVAEDVSGSMIRPVAAFADGSGNTYIREWSGQGDVNDASTWSPAAVVRGNSPEIVGGASGVFLMTSSSDISGGALTLRRIVNGQVAGGAVSLGTSLSSPALSEDVGTGELSFAFTDASGVEVRTSDDGTSFDPTQLASSASSYSIGHLVTATTGDGGGFVSYVQNPQGAEGVGKIVVAAFGTQAASKLPGLSDLTGGGIGSAAGDQLASSTCSSAKFGVVDAEVSPQGSSCFVPDPLDKNMSVTVGTVDFNGLLIIPDPGTRIGIDPKAHEIRTSGEVRVLLRAKGIPDITLFHGPLNLDLPNDGNDTSMFDPYLDGADITKVAGFPIGGSVDVKLVKGGVDIPVSLKLPSYLGGLSGAAILHAASFSGLSLKSLDFSVPDVNLGAIELQKLQVHYQSDGDVWMGGGKLLLPAGGSAFTADLSVEFDNGEFADGKVDLGLGYPGLPLEADPPPPVLYLTHGGLDLKLKGGTTLTGTLGFGAIPFPPATGDPGPQDFLVSIEAALTASFAAPVTLTFHGDAFLSKLHIGDETLTWVLPDQVTFTSEASITLGPASLGGKIVGVIDPHHGIYSASYDAHVDVGPISVERLLININQSGLRFHVSEFGLGVTVGYDWRDNRPIIDWTDSDPDSDNLIIDPSTGLPWINPITHQPAHYRVPRAVGHVTAGETTFSVPRGATSANLTAEGVGGTPSVILISPSGQVIIPTPVTASSSDASAPAVTLPDANSSASYIGIPHPQAGTWTLKQGPASAAPISAIVYSTTETGTTAARGTLSGRGTKRVLHYHVRLAKHTTATFVERTGKLIHTIGTAKHASGSIPFTVADGPGGRRQVVAMITNNGLPLKNVILASFTAPATKSPARATGLKVRATRRTFTYSYTPPANAQRVLITLKATDGRALQRTVSARTRRGSLPALGSSDGLTVTVTGLAADGARGPASSATAHRSLTAPRTRAKAAPRKHRR